MGTGLLTAASYNALPPLYEPVNPTAFTCGCFTSCIPVLVPSPNNTEKTPSGIPVLRAAVCIALPTIADVAGCELCAFTITGHPAASAEAVSPPATENANGKLLAPKTTTGPRAININRRSGFGTGAWPGIAVSILASTQEPSFTNAANIFNWLTVLPLSPSILDFGKPVSLQQIVTSSSPVFIISSAIVSKNNAFSAPLFL